MADPLLSEPQPGFYKTKMNGKGPDVPVGLFWIEGEIEDGEKVSDDYMECNINGDRHRDWLKILDLSTRLVPISRADYDFLVDLNSWARDHAPSTPEANPRRPVDLHKLRPVEP